MASKRKAKARVVWDQTEEGRGEKIIIYNNCGSSLIIIINYKI